MFDIGFFELLMIGAIALVLFGPEDLIQFAKTLGRWCRMLKQARSKIIDELQSIERTSPHDKS
jgi:Tat protein translocase TatB subunit